MATLTCAAAPPEAAEAANADPTGAKATAATTKTERIRRHKRIDIASGADTRKYRAPPSSN
jgi:hypothetical protein